MINFVLSAILSIAVTTHMPILGIVSGFDRTVLQTGLISWWAMEETSAATRLDSHGSNDLLQVGTPPQDTGKVNFGCRFSTPDRLDINTAPTDLKLAADRTFVWWYKHDIAVGAAQFFGVDVVSGGNREYSLTHTGGAGASIQFFAWNSSATLRSVTDATNLQDGQWYFVVAVYDQSAEEIRLEVDLGGFSVTDVLTATMKTSTTKDFAVGHIEGGANWLDGTLDEMAVWSRVLSTEELAILYNNGNGITYTDIL